jgi:hypothetical protein
MKHDEKQGSGAKNVHFQMRTEPRFAKSALRIHKAFE